MFLIAAQNIILSTIVPKQIPVKWCLISFIIVIDYLRCFQSLPLEYQTNNQKLKKIRKIFTIPKLMNKDQ